MRTVLLRAFGVTDKGPVRPTNEDCFAIDEALNLCVVADGMGGHNAGEVAARIAVETILEHVRSAEASRTWPFGYDPGLSSEGNVLRTAVHLANMRVLEAAGTGEGYAGMGTTIVAAHAAAERLVVAHVGDSRLYLLDGGGLSQITKDDSWVATVLAQDPKADRAVLQHHPMRNALTNVVGGRARTSVHVVERMLEGGEVLLLTTDGVHGVLDEGRLAALMTGTSDPAAMARQVVAAALARGSRDNCTAVAARFTQPTNL